MPVAVAWLSGSHECFAAAAGAATGALAAGVLLARWQPPGSRGAAAGGGGGRGWPAAALLVCAALAAAAIPALAPPNLQNASIAAVWALGGARGEAWLGGVSSGRLGSRLALAERRALLIAGATALVAATRAVTGASTGAAAVAALLCGGSALAALAAAPVMAAAPAPPPRLRLRSGGSRGGCSLEEMLCVLWLVVLPLAAEYAALRVAVLRAEPLAWLCSLVTANAGAFIWLAGVLVATLTLAARGATGAGTPLLVTRKAFHVAALVLFVPPVLHALAGGDSLAFLQVASAGALQLALLTELLRASLPWQSAWRQSMSAALQPFRDSRDAEPLVLSHLYLIAGCCLPVVLAGAGGTTPVMALLALAGVFAALGDAAAAAAGLAAAAHGSALPWAAVLGGCKHGKGELVATLSRKTVQGTAAFTAVAAAASLAVLLAASAGDISGADSPLLHAAVAGSALIAAGVETLTLGVDNMLLPFVYYVLLHLAGRGV